MYNDFFTFHDINNASIVNNDSAKASISIIFRTVILSLDVLNLMYYVLRILKMAFISNIFEVHKQIFNHVFLRFVLSCYGLRNGMYFILA